MADIQSKTEQALIGKLAHLPCFAAMPGTENESFASVDQRFEQCIVILEIVFQVRILNQDEVSSRILKSSPHRMALAARLVFEDDFYSRMPLISSCNLMRSVGRIAFDNNDFDIQIGQLLFQKQLHQRLKRRSFVVSRQDDGELPPFGNRRGAAI